MPIFSKYTNKVCYTLNINIPNEEKYLLFRLLRKKRIAEEAKNYHKRKNYNKINIVSIEKLDRTADMTCIYINDPNHLYLPEQYIPTHNTTLVKYIIQSLPNINPETDVCFTSFTGKATQVLYSKGNNNSNNSSRNTNKPKKSGAEKAFQKATNSAINSFGRKLGNELFKKLFK